MPTSTTRKPCVRKFDEVSPKGLATVPGVEIFAVANVPDPDSPDGWRTYTPDDLEAIVTNFNRFSAGPDPQVAVAVAIGHEEPEQDDRISATPTGEPAVGWVSRVWISDDGLTLLADFVDVLPIVAQAIANRTYRKISAEIYDAPAPDLLVGGPDGPAPEPNDADTGPMLRRVSLLGAEPQAIRSLADLPMPVQQLPAADAANSRRFSRVTFHCAGNRLCGTFDAPPAAKSKAMLKKLLSRNMLNKLRKGKRLSKNRRHADMGTTDEFPFSARRPSKRKKFVSVHHFRNCDRKSRLS